MSQGARVKLEWIEAGMKVCDIASSELEKRAKDLRRKLQQAEDEWRDAKYQELSEIVESCISSLEQPREELEASRHALEKLADVVRKYEESRV